MGYDRQARKSAQFMRELGDHMLTHQPDEVTTEDWWSAMLQAHADQAVIAIEAEKWRLPLAGVANEPREAFLAISRLALMTMVVCEYYRLKVDQDWFEKESDIVTLLPGQHALRLLSERGLLPGYSETETPRGGTGADT